MCVCVRVRACVCARVCASCCLYPIYLIFFSCLHFSSGKQTSGEWQHYEVGSNLKPRIEDIEIFDEEQRPNNFQLHVVNVAMKNKGNNNHNNNNNNNNQERPQRQNQQKKMKTVAIIWQWQIMMTTTVKKEQHQRPHCSVLDMLRFISSMIMSILFFVSSFFTTISITRIKIVWAFSLLNTRMWSCGCHCHHPVWRERASLMRKAW